MTQRRGEISSESRVRGSGGGKMEREEEEEEEGESAGAQRGQAEPSELQWRSGSPTFLSNTVYTA